MNYGTCKVFLLYSSVISLGRGRMIPHSEEVAFRTFSSVFSNTSAIFYSVT